MKGEIGGTQTCLQRAILAVFGGLYNKQLNDIKHEFDLDEEGNELIKSGIIYGEDARMTRNMPKYSNAVKGNRNGEAPDDNRQRAAAAVSTNSSRQIQQQQRRRRYQRRYRLRKPYL